MEIDFQFDYETAFQMLLSFLIGTALGLEREFRSKAAGLRTMIMICLGSTIFTEISLAIGGASPDRIASTVITGIGFLGAGVIFKDGLTISGITTATTIWISAALGMAVGAGEYFMALTGSGVTLIVLTAFEKIKLSISRRHQARSYRITLQDEARFARDFEEAVRNRQLRFLTDRDIRTEQGTVLVYEVFGREQQLDDLNNFLKNDARVKYYEY